MRRVRETPSGSAQNAYSYKRDGGMTGGRERCRATWHRCHDLEQKTDYSTEMEKVTIYVVTLRGMNDDKFMDGYKKFKY